MNIAQKKAAKVSFADPSDESLMLAQSAARFITEHYSLSQRAGILTQSAGELSGHWHTMAQLGWLAAPLPERAGGLGLAVRDLLPFLRQLGAGLVLEPYGPAILHCAACLANALPADTAEATLGPLLQGERLEILIDAPEATATRNGDDWHINLSARALLGSGAADGIWIVAQHHDALKLFRVRQDQTLHLPMRLIDGQAAADITVNCKAEPVQTEGLAQALEKAREMSLFGVLAETDGLISALYEETLAYVKMREQFGRPLGKFQSLQHRLADMFILREECLSLTQLAAETFEHPDATYRKRVLSCARVKLADAAKVLSREAVQMHGGMGVTDELAVGHRVKRLMVLAQQGRPRHQHLASLQR